MKRELQKRVRRELLSAMYMRAECWRDLDGYSESAMIYKSLKTDLEKEVFEIQTTEAFLEVINMITKNWNLD